MTDGLTVEYEVERVNHGDSLEEILNRRAEEGWHFVSCDAPHNGGPVIFARTKPYVPEILKK